MTAENFNATLADLCHAKPFREFTIELNDGRRFEIDRPVAFRDGVAGYLGPKGSPTIFYHAEVSQIIPSAANADAT